MKMPYVRVLGSADWHQTKHNDHSCYTVNDDILIDACPGVVTHLLDHDVDPVHVHYLCFTHLHADHYMGLPPLLHYLRVCRDRDLSGLTIIGPRATVRDAVERSLAFVFFDAPSLADCVTRMTEIIELEGDQEIELTNYRLRAMNSDHAVPGLCYRIEDEKAGGAVGFTGDTRYKKAFGGFFADVDLLAHEASFGAGPVDEAVNARCRHASAQEAVRVCREAGVGHLLLTHAYEPKRQGALDLARSQLDIPVDWAQPYEVYPFGGAR